jgi:hypothetical protein
MTTPRYTAQEMLEKAANLRALAHVFKSWQSATAELYIKIAEMLKQAAGDLQARPTRGALSDELHDWYYGGDDLSLDALLERLIAAGVQVRNE